MWDELPGEQTCKKELMVTVFLSLVTVVLLSWLGLQLSSLMFATQWRLRIGKDHPQHAALLCLSWHLRVE